MKKNDVSTSNSSLEEVATELVRKGVSPSKLEELTVEVGNGTRPSKLEGDTKSVGVKTSDVVAVEMGVVMGVVCGDSSTSVVVTKNSSTIEEISTSDSETGELGEGEGVGEGEREEVD